MGPERAEAIIQNDISGQPAAAAEYLSLVENSNTERTAWRGKAACKGVDPELFYPIRDSYAEDAKAVCQQCPVRVPCLEYALASNETEGVWGGLTKRERRFILRQRSG
jgi:WhiB family redox-sensing transcriptional regulator